MFKYTQGSYWGGAHLSFGIFAALAIFPLTGLFGVEQLYLRNPIGALIKLLGNIFSLGFLYFYDVVQIVTDSNNIKKAGIQYPFIGPTGIGAEIFKSSDSGASTAGEPQTAEAPPDTPQSWKYVLFVLLSMIPFGGEHFIVGDIVGGVVKLLCSLIFFLWPIGIVLGLIHVYQGTIGIDGLFKNGLLQIWGGRYSVKGKLGPVGDDKEEKDEKGGNFFKNFMNTLIGALSSLPVVGPIVQKAKVTAETAYETGKTVVIDGVIKPAIKTGTAAASVASTAVTQVPVIAGEVTGKLQQLTTPEGLKQLAAEQGVKVPEVPVLPSTGSFMPSTKLSAVLPRMKGGASEPLISTAALGFVVVALVLTAATTLVLRFTDSKTVEEGPKDIPPEPSKDDRRTA